MLLYSSSLATTKCRARRTFNIASSLPCCSDKRARENFSCSVRGKFLRATLFLLFVQMAGTLTPLILFPSETFQFFPYAPTLEGQYIIKNLTLISAALVVGGSVRFGSRRSEQKQVTMLL